MYRNKIKESRQQTVTHKPKKKAILYILYKSNPIGFWM